MRDISKSSVRSSARSALARRVVRNAGAGVIVRDAGGQSESDRRRRVSACKCGLSMFFDSDADAWLCPARFDGEH